MSKILVTGGAGFIGSYVTDILVKKGHHVFSVDNLSGGFIENVNPKSEFAKLDLTNSKKTDDYIRKIKPEIIYHLAADATEGRSQFTPLKATSNNYLAYLNTLVPAIKNGLEKIVLVSSMSVYGKQKPPFSEKTPTKPVDIYGIAKEAMEKATDILSSVYGFKYIIIRPHNVYGPKQNMTDPYRNVISIFINCLMMNKNFYIYGDGNQERAFTYIDDCAPYIVKAGLSDIDKEIFNIGPIEKVNINQISKLILSQFVEDPQNAPPHLQPIYLKDRPNEVKFAYCTNEKAKKYLGFRQQTPLKKGIVETVNYAKLKGPKKFKYLTSLEITTKDTPLTWTDKLI